MFLFCRRLPHSVLQFLPSTWFKTSVLHLTPACSVFLLQSPNYWGPKQLSGTCSHVVHRAPSPWITKVAERSDALHAMLHNPFNKRLLRIRAGKVSKSPCQLISQPCWCFMWRGMFLTCGWQDGLVIGKTVLQVKVQDPSQLEKSVLHSCEVAEFMEGERRFIFLFHLFHKREKHWKRVCHSETIRQGILKKKKKIKCSQSNGASSIQWRITSHRRLFTTTHSVSFINSKLQVSHSLVAPYVLYVFIW